MSQFSARQTEIIDAAILIIAERGIQELTIKNLSERVGISEPALYRHFQNKTAILLGILLFFQRESTAIFDGILAREAPGEAQLAAVLREHCRHLSENPAFSAVVFSEMIFQNERDLASCVAGLMNTARRSITGILERGIETGAFRRDIRIEHMLLIVMGALRLLVTRWHISGYGFDLISEGNALAESMNLLLRAEKE